VTKFSGEIEKEGKIARKHIKRTVQSSKELLIIKINFRTMTGIIFRFSTPEALNDFLLGVCSLIT
jgi:hypothetical protein